MMKKKAQSLGDEFAANLQRALAAAPGTVAATTPASEVAAAPTATASMAAASAAPASAATAASAMPATAPQGSWWQRLPALAARPLRPGLDGTS
jgi:hypothetical protein